MSLFSIITLSNWLVLIEQILRVLSSILELFLLMKDVIQ